MVYAYKWYMHSQENIMKNEIYKILRNTEIRTGHLNPNQKTRWSTKRKKD